MRTPLTIISVNVQTAIEIMEDMGVAEKEPEAGKLLQTAQDEIMRLARMVGGMLTLTSLSEGSEKGIVDLTALLSSSAEMLRLSLQQRGNTLATNIGTGLRVFGSADLLAQVVTNLLQNAGKHTANGTITLSAEKIGTIITVTVSDTGSGIPAELLPRVFERSVSGDGGTGFGLYLCKTIVESHGGRVWIESEHGRSTAVHCSLPHYEGQFGDPKE
jgi:signal transduction histidine kinase